MTQPIDTESFDEITSSTLSWITERYGAVSFNEEIGGFGVSVPCHGGIASGRGATRSLAIAALYKDLTAGLDTIDAERPHEFVVTPPRLSDPILDKLCANCDQSRDATVHQAKEQQQEEKDWPEPLSDEWIARYRNSTNGRFLVPQDESPLDQHVAPLRIWLHKEESDGPWSNAVWCEDNIDNADIEYRPIAPIQAALERIKIYNDHLEGEKILIVLVADWDALVALIK